MNVYLSWLCPRFQILVKISGSKRVSFQVASNFSARTSGVCILSQTTTSYLFFAQQSARSEYGYRVYGELSDFSNCLLQKIETSGSWPVVKKWESYMLPNHSLSAPIDEEHFLDGTRVHAALAEMTSYYLKNEFRSTVRRFAEEFTSSVLSTVAARSKLGQGVNCFCREVIIGGGG